MLTDPLVSRQHARLSQERIHVVVEDLGSQNGTVFAGAKVERARVPLGSVIGLGHTQIAIVPHWHVREVAPSTATAFGSLFGASLAMREIFAILERAAPSDVTVFVEGESGTGKELVARSLHQASTRAQRPYLRLRQGRRRRVRARGQGVLSPLANMFWGDRWGMVADPFGNQWQLGCKTEEVTPEEMQQRMAKLPG